MQTNKASLLGQPLWVHCSSLSAPSHRGPLAFEQRHWVNNQQLLQTSHPSNWCSGATHRFVACVTHPAFTPQQLLHWCKAVTMSDIHTAPATVALIKATHLWVVSLMANAHDRSLSVICSMEKLLGGRGGGGVQVNKNRSWQLFCKVYTAKWR